MGSYGDNYGGNYDTGAPAVKKHGMPFSVFEWAVEEKPTVILEHLKIKSSLSVVIKNALRAIFSLPVVQRNVIKSVSEIALNYELSDALAAYKAYRIYNAVKHKGSKHFLVKTKGFDPTKILDLGDW